ncbi:Decaprenyl diphosphate synthase-like protein [Mycena latifolia]|nr:Decaprenyl diphosphate synthase-like protein [Mycena latifolia]
MQSPPPTSDPSSASFQLVVPARDVRDYLPPLLLMALVSPLGLSVLAYPTCLAALGIYWGLPPLVRLRWPTFMKANILDDLRINAGVSMSLFASSTALLLQFHNPSIGLAVMVHSEFYSRPLVRLLRTYLYLEMALNGTSEEKEQTASWLRWMHRHVHGSINEETRKELGMPDDVDRYGYIDELKAYIIQTLAWATIAFQERFGRRLSTRAKDTVVLEYTCAGLRLGIPQSMLATTYDDFLIAFNHRVDRLDSGSEFTRTVVHDIEASILSGNKHWITDLLVRAALMVGYSLLPERVKSKYQLEILESRAARAVQWTLCAGLWLIYPCLMLIPLRGVICLLLVLEPELRPILRSSLQAIHCMDILQDKPILANSKGTDSAAGLPYYVSWLVSGKQRPSLLQMVLIRTLEAQLQSGSWTSAIRAWLSYPFIIAETCAESAFYTVDDWMRTWRSQLSESALFHSGSEAKMPLHIGIIMDGNRRYARQIGEHVLVGHAKGAATASKVLEWWLKYLPNTVNHAAPTQPKYLTCWAFSSENFERAENERDGLFVLMAAEFKSLAFTSLVHLFRVRVRFIGGQRHRFPLELLETMDMVEQITASYDGLFLQIAVGYGGRQEVVSAAQILVAQGKEITEQNIGRETYCCQLGVPPVSLIIRTSERRTSGFFLWDTQAAELHFIDKLWPQLTEIDWLDALKSFSRREIRGGK